MDPNVTPEAKAAPISPAPNAVAAPPEAYIKANIGNCLPDSSTINLPNLSQLLKASSKATSGL